MDCTRIPTAEEIHASILKQGFDLNLVPPACTTLFKHSTSRLRTCLLNEFILILARTRLELKNTGIDWDHLELPQQQQEFEKYWNKRKERVGIAFGDTQQRLGAPQREGEVSDKAIPNGDTEGNTAQKKRKRTEIEPNEPNPPTVAPQHRSAGTRQTVNGLTAGSQHQGLLKPVHAHAPKKPSPLGQFTSADEM